MPTYEYICDACGTEFEKFQSIKADPIKICPNCGKEQVRRKISGGAAIIFKGGGFYETDYRSDSYNAAKKKDAEAGKPVEAKVESATTDTAKSDGPKSDTPKSDGPKSDAPKSDSRESGAAKAEPAKSQTPKPAAAATPSSAPKPGAD